MVQNWKFNLWPVHGNLTRIYLSLEQKKKNTLQVLLRAHWYSRHLSLFNTNVRSFISANDCILWNCSANATWKTRWRTFWVYSFFHSGLERTKISLLSSFERQIIKSSTWKYSSFTCPYSKENTHTHLSSIYQYACTTCLKVYSNKSEVKKTKARISRTFGLIIKPHFVSPWSQRVFGECSYLLFCMQETQEWMQLDWIQGID